MVRKPFFVLAMSLVLFVAAGVTGDCVAQDAPPPDLQAANRQQNQQPGAAASHAVEAEITELRKEVEGTEKTLSQMQKVDSKVADIAPWFAAAIALVALFPILLVGYEWSFRKISEKRYEDFKAEVLRAVDFAKAELDKSANEKINSRVDFIITSELKRLTQNIESDYSRNLAQVENIFYSFLQNEFLRNSGSGNAQISSAVNGMYIFRHLLVLLVAGNSKERLTALLRLSEEYVKACGPSTKTFLGDLLGRLEGDSRFVRQEIARALEDLMQQCA
jgi:hypothetical protein